MAFSPAVGNQRWRRCDVEHERRNDVSHPHREPNHWRGGLGPLNCIPPAILLARATSCSVTAACSKSVQRQFPSPVGSKNAADLMSTNVGSTSTSDIRLIFP